MEEKNTPLAPNPITEDLAETVKEQTSVPDMDAWLDEKDKFDPAGLVGRIKWIGFLAAIIGLGLSWLSAKGNPSVILIGKIFGYSGVGVYFICRIIEMVVRSKNRRR
jgi:hypothetical protein